MSIINMNLENFKTMIRIYAREINVTSAMKKYNLKKRTMDREMVS